MSRTRRANYRGEPIRDGEHGKKCPEANCNVCGTGYMKRVLRRRRRAELLEAARRLADVRGKA